MRFKETQIITFANQKGGCGKTSSAISVAAAFSVAGYSVCLVDTDSQCNTTDTLGIDPDEHIRAGHSTLADIYLKRMPASEVEVEYGERFQGLLSLVPGHRALRSVGARLESEKIAALASDQNSILDADDIANEHRQRLKESLNTLRGKRDLVIIDTPPDLGFEMTTALIASDWFVIPVFPSGYDLKGLETLARTVEKIRKRYNPNLRLAGVLLGNYDKTAKLDADIHKALVKKFGDELVFGPQSPEASNTASQHFIAAQFLSTRRLTKPPFNMEIPQWEFGFTPETFNLVVESGIDGDRIVGEQAVREALRSQAESDQSKLFEESEPHVHSDMPPPPTD